MNGREAQHPESTPALVQEFLEDGLYTVDEKEPIRDFLLEHPDSIPLLREAREIIPIFFGSVDVGLKVIENPKDEGIDNKDLYGVIHTPSVLPTVREQLGKFETEWWLKAKENSKGKIHFDVKPTIDERRKEIMRAVVAEMPIPDTPKDVLDAFKEKHAQLNEFVANNKGNEKAIIKATNDFMTWVKKHAPQLQ